MLPQRRLRRRGTTLIEMLVVILIIALIASIVYVIGHKLWQAVMNLKG